jgi:5-dehydro-2-deoxygluconokinase
VTQPEIITIGRIGVDLYPEQIGVHLADVTSFAKGLGGTGDQRGGAAARARPPQRGDHEGRRRRVRARTPPGARGFGVDARWVGTDPELQTPVTFCEIFPPDDFPLLFYRNPTAPTSASARTSSTRRAAQAGLVWTTGTGLSREPSRTAVLTALETATFAVHDMDDRPMLWPQGETPRDWAPEAVKRADVVVGNQTEAAVAVGEGTPLEQAAAAARARPAHRDRQAGPEGRPRRDQRRRRGRGPARAGRGRLRPRRRRRVRRRAVPRPAVRLAAGADAALRQRRRRDRGV